MNYMKIGNPQIPTFNLIDGVATKSPIVTLVLVGIGIVVVWKLNEYYNEKKKGSPVL